MNIGIDIRTIGKNRTGDEVYTTQLVDYLKNNAKDIFYLFTDTKNYAHNVVLQHLPANIRIISILPKQKVLWTFFLLPYYCFKYKIDVLHVQYITPILLPKKTRLITTIHDISWKFLPQYITKKDLFFLNTLIPISINRADTIITVSEHSKQAIDLIYKIQDPSKVKVVYNGGFISSEISEDFKNPLELLKNRPYILYLGSLQPRKNIPALIEAYVELQKNYLDKKWPLLIIAGGKGHNYDDKIDVLVNKYKLSQDVILPGFISEGEKMWLLKNSQVFVFPSLYEGFGIPVIEAMSLGSPVITSSYSCLPEIVGDAGKVADVTNKELFAQEIYTMLSNKIIRQQYVEKGLKRAQDFKWEKMGEKTLEIYKELLFK